MIDLTKKQASSDVSFTPSPEQPTIRQPSKSTPAKPQNSVQHSHAGEPGRKQLFVIYHCPSSNTQYMLDALLQGACQVSGLDVHSIAALTCDAKDLHSADAIIILTTENLGYMAGGTKDWFDRIYYPLLEKKQGMPYCCVIRAGLDGTGTQRAIQSICQGLKWKPVQAALVCQGEWRNEFTHQCKDLGQLMGECLNMSII